MTLSTEQKNQFTEWEKFCTNHISDKGVIARIYKGFLKLNNRKTKNPI